jgi:hypothetical protein
MTRTPAQFAALALSALMTLGVVAGMNGIATKEYAAADRLALAQDGLAQVALQQVIVVGHRTAI